LNFHDIKKLVKLVENSEIGRIEIEEPDFRIAIEKQLLTEAATQPPVVLPATAAPVTPATAPAPAPPVEETPAPADNQHVITSPMVGTFYTAPSPDDPDFASVGDEVTPGQVICIIEAMKVMNEIEADIRGIVRRVMVDNSQPVQFEDPLFIIEPL